jgi:superfamily I DNA/RNA helicase
MDLTEQQRELVVDAPGNFLLLACPGSGKTRSATARVQRLVNEGEKVAACSYTNVGAERLAAMLARDAKVVLGPEHFVGTIHTFLLRYVLYPFAHLIGANKGPHVRIEGTWPDLQVGDDHRKRVHLDAFRMRPDGSLMVASPPRFASSEQAQAKLVEQVGGEVLRRKSAIFTASGALTGDDAMWKVLRILRERPAIAANVAARFDEILIDEAQDTSELQLACVAELLKPRKLASLVLIGDLDQSIYSFQGASADGCRQLAGWNGLRTVHLSENHRCSQLICDAAASFGSKGTPDQAVGPDAACPIKPEVFLYPAKSPEATADVFRARLDHHGIDPAEAAILVRRTKIANQINGIRTPLEMEPRPYRVGRLAADLAAGRLGRHDVLAAQQMLAHSAYGVGHLDELLPEQASLISVATYRFLHALPPLQGDLKEWVRSAASALQGAVTAFEPNPKHTGAQTLRTLSRYTGHAAAEVFSTPAPDLGAQTVHSIKGEEREAIMLVIHRPHGSDPTGQLDIWGQAVIDKQIAAERAEEQRVAFVALTRARKYFVVAVPDTARGREIAAACAGMHFNRV